MSRAPKHSRLLRRLVPLIVVAVPLLAPAASHASTVAMFSRFTYQDATNATDAARYQFLDLGYGSSPSSQSSVRSLIASIHKADPATKILLYKNTVATPNDPTGIGTCVGWNSSKPLGGIPLSWFLKDPSGNPIFNSTYKIYELDPSNTSVQQACLNSAVTMAKTAGYNGIFWDMVSTSLHWAGYNSSNCGSTACGSDTNWHNTIDSFVKNVSAGLHSNGLLAIGNVSGGAINGFNGGPAWWQKFQLDGLDGAQEESFTSGTNHLPVGLAQWQQGLANELWNEAHGKYMLTNADVTTNQTLAVYGLATMLLGAQGRTSWDTASGDYGTGEYWFPQFDTAQKLGLPSAPHTVQSNGLYVRKFQYGSVAVNPTTSTIKDATYGSVAANTGIIKLGGTTRKADQAPQIQSLAPAGGASAPKLAAGQTWFYSTKAADPDGDTNLTYSWNWGDGTTGCSGVPRWTCASTSVAHAYAQPGAYTITVSVHDSAGILTTRQLTVTVLSSPVHTLFAVNRALGGSVLTYPGSGGSVNSVLVVPGGATKIVGTIKATRCPSRTACARAARSLFIGSVTRSVSGSVLRLRVSANHRQLVKKFRTALRRTHRRTVPAVYTLQVTLANGRTVAITQHLKLLF